MWGSIVVWLDCISTVLPGQIEQARPTNNICVKQGFRRWQSAFPKYLSHRTKSQPRQSRMSSPVIPFQSLAPYTSTSRDTESHFYVSLEPSAMRQLKIYPSFIQFVQKADPLSLSTPLLLHSRRDVVDVWIAKVDGGLQEYHVRRHAFLSYLGWPKR
ncbi:hypothetical protein L210DRAFT_2291362 [Boletus edulis BED1]|uniref:Uncharacterized protein n=1 Tax=Boletus edulis BED1 TaxID=1328754 RepID=A0AAD4G692_BOLED|nr:hypothetical protein L210DRAFT_2291362 [Boletus edulis BED1]